MSALPHSLNDCHGADFIEENVLAVVLYLTASKGYLQLTAL